MFPCISLQEITVTRGSGSWDDYDLDFNIKSSTDPDKNKYPDPADWEITGGKMFDHYYCMCFIDCILCKAFGHVEFLYQT